MKRFAIITLINVSIFILIMGACKPNPQRTAKSATFEHLQKLMQADQYARNHPRDDYKAIPNSGYILPVEMSRIKDREKNASTQFTLFEQAIPMGGIKLLEWENGMTWQKADNIYKGFVAKNIDNQYIDPFRENGSYEILVRLNLLNDTSEKGLIAIHYYLQQLIIGKSLNTTLIYYCINKLRGHYPDSTLKDIAKTAVSNYETSKRRKIYMAQFSQLKENYVSDNRKDSATPEEIREVISTAESSFRKDSIGMEKLKTFITS